MDPRQRVKLLVRGAWAVAATLFVLSLAWAWTYSNVLRNELVTITDLEPVRDIEIATVGSGRIRVARTPITETEGIWGVVGPAGYGQASVVIGSDAITVERAFRTLEGSFDVGEKVSFDPVAYTGDPESAHGISFSEVRFSGDLGVYPAWVIDGDRDLWVLIVHGSGPGERREALRIIPALVKEGYPVMAITVRGDRGAPPPGDRLRALGATEWRDVAAAIEFAFAQDAEEFVLLGMDSGASIVATYLHEADDVTPVRGAVFDSALHDPEAIADRLAAERRVPAPMRAAGKLLARLRFDIDWNQLDQVARAAEYTVPTLVLHGEADEVVDIELAERFVAALGDLATYEPFPNGAHGQLWNVDPDRYESVLARFIEGVRSGS